MLMQQALGFALADALAHGDEAVFGHQLGNTLARIGGKAHIAVGENANQFAGLAVDGAFDHRNAGDPVVLHQVERFLQRRARLDGQWVHHHAGFEFLDLAYLRRLLVGLQITMDDADAAGLRHGDGHLGFGHRIHRRGDDRDID